MGLFTKSKELISKEYTDLLGKFSQLANEIGIIKGQVAALETHTASIRGIVNRKLGRAEEIDESGEKRYTKKEVKDLLSSMGIVGDGEFS